ncbi:Uncharacterised protein [Mycobacteroides abscessus subsp. massiliense]|nr:Uncharacterised protein [Mycobacteroides abscessus subsp. massiliense]
MTLQCRGDARQQTRRIGRADLHDLLVGVAGRLEPSDAGWGGRVVCGHRRRGVPDDAGGELRGLAFTLIEGRDDIGIAIDGRDELLAQQPGRRR